MPEARQCCVEYNIIVDHIIMYPTEGEQNPENLDKM